MPAPSWLSLLSQLPDNAVVEKKPVGDHVMFVRAMTPDGVITDHESLGGRWKERGGLSAR